MSEPGPEQRWALRLYLGLAGAITPVWRWGLQRRLRRGKETEASIRQKLMTEPAARPDGPLVWGHAVGVGEALALAGLFTRLAQALPGHAFLITTTARTSGDALKKMGLPPRCQHQFAPIDTPATCVAFVRHWRPSLAIWCEMDLWPALIAATHAQAVPTILVNARLSRASLAKRRWAQPLYAALLSRFVQLFAQNAETAQALVALGALPTRVVVSGTIKALAPPLPCDATDLADLTRAIGARPVWLLASSHPGEEALALAAHQQLLAAQADALLIIAPRAPARGAEVAALAGPGAALRSRGQALTTATTVYVADTIGEMGLWYRLSPVALVGGSLAQVGGHNPYEPLALGCAVLSGPNVWNFAESYAELQADTQADTVLDAQQTAHAVATVWHTRRDAGANPAAARLPPGAQALLDRLQALAEHPEPLPH
ncbi:3-deoxy-D-manno-octulosonic acid transferase [Hydrogenophaga sp.]|uniref:3-deoxy-D-manno-octulosonic acid transferase n=1 Tax=Hydrogenophaga sp. TaxID=1904254 RepID=UPI0035689C7F